MTQNSGFFYQFFSSERFFYDTRRNIGFQPVKSPYFCVGQQKKEPLEKNRYFGTCKATECIIIFEF